MSSVEIHHIDFYLKPKSLEQFLDFCKTTGLLKPEYDFYDDKLKYKVVRMHLKPMLKEGVLLSFMSSEDPKAGGNLAINEGCEGINHIALRVKGIDNIVKNLIKMNPNIVIEAHTNKTIDKPKSGVEGAKHVHLDRRYTGMVHLQLIAFECPECGTQMFRMNQKYCHECGAKMPFTLQEIKGEKIPNYYEK